MWQSYLCGRHPSLASLPTCHRLWPPTAIHPKREEQSLLHPQRTGPCLCDVPSPPPAWASHLPTRPPPASQEDQESPSAAPWAPEAQPCSVERHVGHVMVIESQDPPWRELRADSKSAATHWVNIVLCPCSKLNPLGCKSV